MRHPVLGGGELVVQMAQSYSLTCPFKSGRVGAPNLYPSIVLIDPRMNYSLIKIIINTLLADKHALMGE